MNNARPSPDRPENAAFAKAAQAIASSGSASQSTPTYAQYRQTAEFFDMTFKFETLLDSLSEIFRWTAFLETFLFFVALIFFAVGEDKSMWYLVLALFHVVRSFVGFAIGRIVPSSYDFVEKLEFKGERQLEYRLVRPELTRKVQSLLMEYYDDYEMPARLYTLLAVISFVLDIISFFAVFGLLAGYIGKVDEIEIPNGQVEVPTELKELWLTGANPYLGRIVVIMLYSMCDVLYIFWILHFRSRLGEAERAYVHKALLGFGNDMRIAYGVNPRGGQQSKNKPQNN